MLAFGAEEDEEIFHSVKFIEDVPLIVIVEIGRTVMEVQNVLNLKKGSMVVFEKIVGEPMDIVVGDQLMARGEIVVVNERYGVRISEVTRPDEKVGERRE
ncbi:MAG: FliM/FliN family flagellar motor switch protein [SAR324 cluster bacterium]|jgi:flagellar motor switch protein FliN/FliY|uniref:Flagellar motor switch protein FliN-like C-terminal domain-containing protein n=1 Tax=marine metagenome TaxID=408172 RepID=A0A381NPR0_9ZZZZ|nr:FliM/FliN family flagellar motor switch protein [SAR324 cluster bacterium]MCS5547086.1 FliM/FliN family flagellar motor switch protein [SAR324 cluster bacterium]|tara:strand:- start:109 stop:408 length:300 start_codon:yes stop_codon:yes gene_type:complete